MQPAKKFSIGLLSTFLCLIVLLISSCGPTPAPSPTHAKAAANRQVLISGVEAGIPDIKTLDPGLATDLNSQLAINNIFTGLVQLNDKLEIVDQLAASHQVMPDGVTYKFTLRPNLTFSDGTLLTSQDVVYSINRALDPATKSPTGPYYLKYIKDSDQLQAGKIKTLIGYSLLTPDTNTVLIVTDKPYSFFLNALTDTVSYVVEKSVIDKWGINWTDHLSDNGGQGGSGPWKVSQYTHNKEIDFVPNPNYYGPKPQLAKLVYPFFEKGPTVHAAYMAGQVDDSYVPVANYPQDNTRTDFQQFPVLAIFYYTMNYLLKPFDNIKIRQAFALAINKDLIVNKIWKGSRTPTNHIVPQGMPGYNPNLLGPAGVTTTAGNPTLAKQLFQQGMQEEGWTSVAQIPSITLTLASGGDPSAKNEVAAMQQMWQTVLGINVKTTDIDFNTLIQEKHAGANNLLQFYSGPGWIADYPDPQDWTTLQFDKGAANNGMNYGQNKSSDAAAQQTNQQLMEQADAVSLSPDRLALYNKIEQQLVNEVAWLPMQQQVVNTLHKACVQGAMPNAESLVPPDDWANIYISTDSPCVNATV